MDDEDWKYASRSKTSNEQSKSYRKARKAKSNGSKSKKKNSQILPQKITHSTTASEDLAVGDRDCVGGVEHGGNVDVLCESIEENNYSNAGEITARDESPNKRSRSKSRSRSGSRSRFSNFFRRKKKFESETDLTDNVNHEADTRYESAEDVDKTERPRTLDLRGDTDPAASASQRRSNLKRTSPHHSYDPKIQPRDRLLHMTVADAVKEQQLRRANSASRSSPRRRETLPSTSAIMFLSSPSLAAAMIASDAARKPFGTTTTSSTLPATRSKKPSALHSLVIGNSFPKSGFNMNINDDAETTTVDKDARSSRINDVNIEEDTAYGDVSKPNNLSNYIAKPQNQSPKDLANDSKGETSSQKAHETLSDRLRLQNDHPQPSHSTSAHRTPEEDAIDARIKRQASLSQFLELRQTLPPILTRAHRLSMSSDSGVTSRDTSPCAYPVNSEVKQRLQEQQPSPPAQDDQWKDKAPNPYVVSSISVSPDSITNSSQNITNSSQNITNSSQNITNSSQNITNSSQNITNSSQNITNSSQNISNPSQYMNGQNIETGLKEDEMITNRPEVLRLEDSMAESSSMSSSPQVNSMSSSFRSSDQGYAETDSEDEASFATPPEDVEVTSSTKRERSGRTFHPSILEKLLGTAREKLPKEDYQELDLENSETKRQPIDSKAEISQGRQSTQEVIVGERKGETKSRYIPRGVRRSQSDAESRHKSSRRLYKRTSSKPEDGPQRTGSAEGISTSPNVSRDKVSFELDKQSTPSTTTLTNQDGLEMDFLSVERNDQKLVPVMGTVAQQKYRRTYSPSRVRKIIPALKDENGRMPGPDITASPIKIPVQEVISSVSATSLEQHARNDVPEKPSNLSLTKIDQSPTMPRKGILKSPIKDKMASTEDNKESIQKLDSKGKLSLTLEPCSINKTENTEENVANFQNTIQTKSKTDTGDCIISEMDISGETTPIVETKKDKKLKKQKRKEKLSKSENTTQTAQKQDVAMPSPTVQITFDNSPNIEISNSFLGKDSMSKGEVTTQIQTEGASPSKSLIEKSNSASDIIVPTQPHGTSEETTTSRTGSDKTLTIDFPLIHGLEVGMHKVHSFSGYSLADYLKEHSKVNWKQQPIPQKGKEIKTPKSSLKKKASPNIGIRKQPSEVRIDIKEVHEQKPKSTLDTSFVEHKVKDIQSNTLKIMVDKECQTSAWLINTLVRKKSSKSKKKMTSFSKKKKQQQHRRGSSVSDTFIPTDLKRHKESVQHSSLGDIRSAYSKESNFTNRLVRGSSEKTRRRDNKISPDMLIAGSSSKSRTDNKNDDSQLPKPKKLTLTAVILLKNRLAKYREKKRTDKQSFETVEDEPGLDRVSSETLINIENELNLSKLEVSKETDIIDDDFYEPEYSLGYTRKQLRFENLPNEPMQSGEPLPPLPTSRRMRQRRESTLRERKRKCIQYCKKFIAFLFSHIGLCSLVVAYTILGGFIFQALENKAEYKVRGTVKLSREEVVGKLVSLAIDFQKTEQGMEDFTGEVNTTITNYQGIIHRLTKDKGWDGKEDENEDGLWTFASSLLYAITVTTTIGYGHVAPKTPEGRMVTIGYAVVGIPLTLLCLTNIGDVMATGFRLLYGKICCGVCCTLFKPRRRRIQIDLESGLGGPIVTTEEEQPDKPKEVIHVPTSLCLLLIAAYIFAGAMLFAMWESWDMLTGSYFCFITLSTIGFGDIVPGMDSNAWAAEEKLVLCALYLVLGLSLIAMCFNLVQEDVKAKCRWLGMKLGIVDKHETPL